MERDVVEISQKMKIDEKEFLHFLRKGLIQFNYGFGQIQEDFIIKKAKQLVELINELDGMALLKNLTQEEIDQVNETQTSSSINMGEIGKLADTFINMVRNLGDTRGTGFKLKDENEKEYIVTAHQIASFLGIAYSSSCEFSRIWLSQLIDTSKFDREPTGIGSLKWALQNNGALKLDFFDHIDSELRNSFFHLNFEFKNMKVYYKDNSGQTKSIGLPDLFKMAINTDRGSLVLMYLCMFYVKKQEEKNLRKFGLV
ncbi:hypothetical protein JYT91_00645 [archaeon AH-315-M20]|nr:hypothetical protein [archaeon AH-315-M20]